MTPERKIEYTNNTETPVNTETLYRIEVIGKTGGRVHFERIMSHEKFMGFVEWLNRCNPGAFTCRISEWI